jgi:LacI family transcriptional regulator
LDAFSSGTGGSDVPSGRGVSVNRVTISDVAKAAGVSMKSVSRVINSEASVSDALRAKVQAAIDRLGYVPDVAARSLAGARSFSIGLLFEDFGDAAMPSYLAKLQTGAYRVCREHGYHLLVEFLPPAGEAAVVRFTQMLRTLRVDGFILAPPFSDDRCIMDALDARGIPYVRIAPFTDYGTAPRIVIDDVQAVRELTHYLWELGHRRFGFVAGREGHGAAHARRQGLSEALQELGAARFVEAYGGFQFNQGVEAARLIMRSPTPPTAIFAANDDSAAGVMAGLAQLGFKVPDEVSVAGFDDSWIAQSVWPHLTTIHQPIAEMGIEAAMRLIARNGQFDARLLPPVETRLMIRGSTAPPRIRS